jgi:hypothetical protein
VHGSRLKVHDGWLAWRLVDRGEESKAGRWRGDSKEIVEVEKQISPLRSSQSTRTASVEMTILFDGERERRTTLAGSVIGVQLDIEKKKRAEIGSLSPLSLKANR